MVSFVCEFLSVSTSVFTLCWLLVCPQVHIARNPLFQWTLARNYKVNAMATAGSCLSYRIDRFKRATKACAGSTADGSSFYLVFNLSKCCLFSGDWEYAAAQR